MRIAGTGRAYQDLGAVLQPNLSLFIDAVRRPRRDVLFGGDMAEGLCLLKQCLTKIWMSDFDQRKRPFTDRLAKQVRDAELRDHVVHIRAGDADSFSKLEPPRIRDSVPSSDTEARQMIGLPPEDRAAPRMKSGCAETPP